MSLLEECLKNLTGLTGLSESRIRKIERFIGKNIARSYKYADAEKRYQQGRIGSDSLLRSASSLKDIESAYELGIHRRDHKLERISLRLWVERAEKVMSDVRSFETGMAVLFSTPIGSPVEKSIVSRIAETAENLDDLEWLLWFAVTRRNNSAAVIARERIKAIRSLNS